jgi:hypothetical protein
MRVRVERKGEGEKEGVRRRGETGERVKRRTGVKVKKKERKWTGEGEGVTAQ